MKDLIAFQLSLMRSQFQQQGKCIPFYCCEVNILRNERVRIDLVILQKYLFDIYPINITNRGILSAAFFRYSDKIRELTWGVRDFD